MTPAAYIMGTATYWYAPEVKYFVKCEYDAAHVKYYKGDIVNWELTSFQLKK